MGPTELRLGFVRLAPGSHGLSASQYTWLSNLSRPQEGDTITIYTVGMA